LPAYLIFLPDIAASRKLVSAKVAALMTGAPGREISKSLPVSLCGQRDGGYPRQSEPIQTCGWVGL
jgi:hypothetical protein